MLKFVSLAIALSALPVVVAAQEAQPQQARSQQDQSQQPASKAKAKKICKTIGEVETGSRFGAERVCKTAAEWNKLEQQLKKQ